MNESSWYVFNGWVAGSLIAFSTGHWIVGLICVAFAGIIAWAATA